MISGVVFAHEDDQQELNASVSATGDLAISASNDASLFECFDLLYEQHDHMILAKQEHIAQRILYDGFLTKVAEALEAKVARCEVGLENENVLVGDRYARAYVNLIEIEHLIDPARARLLELGVHEIDEWSRFSASFSAAQPKKPDFIRLCKREPDNTQINDLLQKLISVRIISETEL